MRKSRLVLAALVVAFLASCASDRAFAQDAPLLRSESDVQDLCDRALSNIVNGDISQGIGVLRPYATSISKEDVDALEAQITGQTPTIQKNYGQPLGYLLISKDNLRDTVMRMTYIVKYQKHLIRWNFIFYKPVDSWVLDYFNYDDSIDALFGSRSPSPAN